MTAAAPNSWYFPSLRPPKKTSTASGTMNCITPSTSMNSHDHGCSRRSSSTGRRACAAAVAMASSVPGGSGVVIGAGAVCERVAQVFCIRDVHAAERTHDVARACSVDHQCGQIETAFDRSAHHVQVLHARAGHAGLHGPEAHAAHGEADIIQAPLRVAVLLPRQPDE